MPKKYFLTNDNIFNTLLLNKGFVSAHIVHARGNQLVPKLLLRLSDTLPT